MQDVPPRTEHAVRFPQIVPIVLQEAARLRSNGQLTQSDFEQKLERLTQEDLAPRGLELLVRQLADGTTRFLIKEFRTGSICEMIDCAGRPAMPAAAAP